jgi:hypothetical protein
MALVESRSWTKSGSVGTSNEKRSALPVQFRNGFDRRWSCSSASRSPRTLTSTRPSDDVNSCGASNSCGGFSVDARAIAPSSHSPSSRAPFWPSHSSDGESDES